MCRKATKRSAPFHSALPSEVLCLYFPAMHKRRREERDARATPRKTHRECREEKEVLFSSAAPFLLRTQLGGRESCSVERAPSRLLLLAPRKEKSTKRRNDFTKTKEKEESVETGDSHNRVLLQDINQCHHNHLVSMVYSVSVSAVPVSVILFRAWPKANKGCQWPCVRETDQARGRGRRPRTGRQVRIRVGDARRALDTARVSVATGAERGLPAGLETPSPNALLPSPLWFPHYPFACCRQTLFFARLRLKIFCESLCALQNSP